MRHVYLFKYAHSKTEHANFFHMEVVQEWISEDGKRTVMAKPMNTGGGGWLYGHDISIKNQFGSHGYYSDVYAIYGTLYPDINVLPAISKRGITDSFFEGTPSKVIRWLLDGRNDYEFLIKTKQIDVLHHLWRRGTLQLPYRHVFNICNRNGYIVKDASMYFDYIDLLVYFRLATHNANYVCPANLTLEHDILFQL